MIIVRTEKLKLFRLNSAKYCVNQLLGYLVNLNYN